jgi:predicted cupin superfamily sugar epimerase
MTQPDATELIDRLDLTRHPEGGWFREGFVGALFMEFSQLAPGSSFFLNL